MAKHCTSYNLFILHKNELLIIFRNNFRSINNQLLKLVHTHNYFVLFKQLIKQLNNY